MRPCSDPKLRRALSRNYVALKSTRQRLSNTRDLPGGREQPTFAVAVAAAGVTLAGHAGLLVHDCVEGGVVVAPRPAASPLVRGVAPVQPFVQRVARGVPQLSYGARDRPSALLNRLDRLAPLLLGLARHSRTPNRTCLVQLFVRAPSS